MDAPKWGPTSPMRFVRTGQTYWKRTAPRGMVIYQMGIFQFNVSLKATSIDIKYTRKLEENHTQG